MQQPPGPIPIPNAPFYVPGYSGHVPRPMRQGVGGGVGGTYQPLSPQTSAAAAPLNQQTTTMFNNMTNSTAQQPQQYQQQQPTSYMPQQPQQQQTPIENQNMNTMLDQYLQQFQQQYGPFSTSSNVQPMTVTTGQIPPQQQQYNSFQAQPQAPISNDRQQQPMGSYGNQPQFQQPQIVSEQQSTAPQNRNQSDPTDFGFFGTHDAQPQDQGQSQMFYSQMADGDPTELAPPVSQQPPGLENQHQQFYQAPEAPQTDQNGNAQQQAPAQMMQPPPEVAQQIQEAVIAHIQQQLQQQGAQAQVKPMPSFRNKAAKKSTSKSIQPTKQPSSCSAPGLVQNFAKQQRNPVQKRTEAPRKTTASIYGSPLPISASYSGHIPGVKLNTYGVTFGQAVTSTSQYREKYIHKKK